MHHEELTDAHTIACLLMQSKSPEHLWAYVQKMKRTGSLTKHLEAIEKAILVNEVTNKLK